MAGSIQHSALGRYLRLPEAVVAERGVGEHDQLADDGGGRDFVRHASVGQPLAEGAHVGVGAAGSSAGHVKHLARPEPPALDTAGAARCAAVAGKRSRAGHGRGLLGADAAEFAHVGAEHSRSDGADTRDGPQARRAASQGLGSLKVLNFTLPCQISFTFRLTRSKTTSRIVSLLQEGIEGGDLHLGLRFGGGYNCSLAGASPQGHWHRQRLGSEQVPGWNHNNFASLQRIACTLDQAGRPKR